MSVLYVSAVNIFKIKLFVSVIRSSWSALIGRLPAFPVYASANQSTAGVFLWRCHPAAGSCARTHSWSRSCFYNQEYLTSRVRSSSFDSINGIHAFYHPY